MTREQGQVPDDVALPDAVMRDADSAPAADRPTSCWRNDKGQQHDDVLLHLTTVDSCSRNLTLQGLMTAKEQAKRKEAGGVAEPRTLGAPRAGLPSFDRVDLRPMVVPAATSKGGDHYSDSFWRRHADS